MPARKKEYDVEIVFRMFEILRAAGEAHSFAKRCKGRLKIALDDAFVEEARRAMDRVVPDLIAERPGYMTDILGRNAQEALAESRQVSIELNGGTRCWACP